MSDRNKLVTGLSALSLGIAGGLLVGWAAKNMRTNTLSQPSIKKPQRRYDSSAPSETGPQKEVTAASPVAHQEAPSPEDLSAVEGIGPKINTVLHEAGIVTFAQLAETPVEWLRQILSDANITLAVPDTWPEQAELAAAGNWEELEALQEQLDAGIRR